MRVTSFAVMAARSQAIRHGSPPGRFIQSTKLMFAVDRLSRIARLATPRCGLRLANGSRRRGTKEPRKNNFTLYCSGDVAQALLPTGSRLISTLLESGIPRPRRQERDLPNS